MADCASSAGPRRGARSDREEEQQPGVQFGQDSSRERRVCKIQVRRGQGPGVRWLLWVCGGEAPTWEAEQDGHRDISG